MRSELLGEGENNAAKNISLLIQWTCKLVYLIFIFVDFCKDHAHSPITGLYSSKHFTKVFLAQYFHKTKDFPGTLHDTFILPCFWSFCDMKYFVFLKVNWIINLINLLELKVNKEPCLFSRQ